jgi:hypothetical protein
MYRGAEKMTDAVDVLYTQLPAASVFRAEDSRSAFLRHVSTYLPDYTGS